LSRSDKCIIADTGSRQTILGMAIPKITTDFGGLDNVSWYSAAYFITFGGLEASWGKVFKYFDIKWTLVLTPVVQHSVQQRSIVMGIIGLNYELASVLGPITGGAFTDHVTWQRCFYLNIPNGGIAIGILISFFWLPAAARPASIPLSHKLLHLDPAGVCFAMAAIICYILGLQYAGTLYA
jgi:hypothetical protein